MHFLVRYYEKYSTTGSVIYFDPSAGFAIENDKVLPRNLSLNVILRVPLLLRRKLWCQRRHRPARGALW